LSIGSSLVTIGRKAFTGCPDNIFTVHEDNPVYKSVKGKLKKK
jgi:hypothetical protein